MPDLTLILATQRVGSTYFETGITKMGGLGRAGEHFAIGLEDLRVAAGARARKDLLEVLLEKGRTEDGQVSVTIMSDYFGLIAASCLGSDPEDETDDLATWLRFWEDFSKRFDRIFAFHLTRDPLDQALSQCFSRFTRLNHVIDGTPWFLRDRDSDGELLRRPGTAAQPRMSHDAAAALIRPATVIRTMTQIGQQNDRLIAFADRAGLDVLRVDYESSTGDPGATAERIAAHCKGAALTRDFAPSTAKVVPSDAAEVVTGKVAAFMGRQVDVSDGDARKRLSQAAMRLARSRHTSIGKAEFALRRLRWRLAGSARS